MADADVPNNPASRLHALLESMHDHKGSAFDAWCTALTLPSDDPYQLFDHVAELRRVPGQADDAIRSIPDLPHDELLIWHPPLATLIGSSFANTAQAWRDLEAPVTGAHLHSLKICAGILATHRPEPVLPRADIDAIHEDVWQLRKTILASDLERDVKDFLLRQLADLDQALQSYRVRGIEALATGIEELSGRVLAQKDLAVKSRATRAGDAFFKLVDRINSISKLRENLPEWVALMFFAIANREQPTLPDLSKPLMALLEDHRPPIIEHYTPLLPPPPDRALPDDAIET